MRADLEAARIGNVRADRSRLLLLANQRIAQNRLLEPAGRLRAALRGPAARLRPEVRGPGRHQRPARHARARRVPQGARGRQPRSRGRVPARRGRRRRARPPRSRRLRADHGGSRRAAGRRPRRRHPASCPRRNMRRTHFVGPDLPGARPRTRHGRLGGHRVHRQEGRHDERRSREGGGTGGRLRSRGARRRRALALRAARRRRAARQARLRFRLSEKGTPALPDRKGTRHPCGYFATARSCARPSSRRPRAHSAATPAPSQRDHVRLAAEGRDERVVRLSRPRSRWCGTRACR